MYSGYVILQTNYTGFWFGSESHSNFVYSFSAACVVKLLHTSRRCFLSFQAVMGCGLIARWILAISLFHGRSPRPSAFMGLRSLGPGSTAWNSLPAYLKNNDLSPAIFRSKLKTHFFSSTPNSYVYQLCLLTCLYDFSLVHFCSQATRHSCNGYWSVREHYKWFFVSYLITTR